MQTRRQQKPITIRSDRAAERLRLLTRGGRSQAAVIEEALEQMPVPMLKVEVTPEVRAERIARLDAIIERASKRIPPLPSMAEFDAREYDERGNPR